MVLSLKQGDIPFFPIRRDPYEKTMLYYVETSVKGTQALLDCNKMTFEFDFGKWQLTSRHKIPVISRKDMCSLIIYIYIIV